MTDLSLKLGQTVACSDGRKGTIRFIGDATFAKGRWLGLELVENTGKNDGSVNGRRYFQCRPGYGIFLRPETIQAVLDEPPRVGAEQVAPRKVNGQSTKSRTSEGLYGGDEVRKRRGVIASTTPGTRLSLRVGPWISTIYTA